jgi:hypothetical protein
MQTNQGQPSDFRKNIRMTMMLAQCISLVFAAILRIPGTTGSHLFRGHAAIGLLILFLAATLTHSPGLFLLFFASLVMMVLHKIIGAIRRQKGYMAHSGYVGLSWFGWRANNYAAIRFGEPLIVFVFGLILHQHESAAVGSFLIVGAISLFLDCAWMAAADAAEARAVTDSRISQQYLMERVRQG